MAIGRLVSAWSPGLQLLRDVRLRFEPRLRSVEARERAAPGVCRHEAVAPRLVVAALLPQPAAELGEDQRDESSAHRTRNIGEPPIVNLLEGRAQCDRFCAGRERHVGFEHGIEDHHGVAPVA